MVIGRRAVVVNLAPRCHGCGLLVADVDVIRGGDGEVYCSVECAPADDRDEVAS